MRKRRFLPSGLLLFLAAGLLAPAPSGFAGKALGQDQPERPKFFALRVVCEKKVQNAKDSLGAPDGRYAEILPGEQLVVLMEKKLYPSPIIGNPEFGAGLLDSGSIVGKGGADIGLEGWFPMQNTQGKQDYDWIPLELSTTGFFISPPPLPIYSPEGSAGVDMIRITNPGTKSLFVDAVIGYGREAESRPDPDHPDDDGFCTVRGDGREWQRVEHHFNGCWRHESPDKAKAMFRIGDELVKDSSQE